MNILAVESSCDDMSWAIIADGKDVCALEIANQNNIHAETGGVVPEVAAREHSAHAFRVLDKVLDKGINMEDIDAIAVTYGPGLLGSLLVGLSVAKTLAYFLKKPLIPVHHIEGHIYSNWLARDVEIAFPAVALTVSGGHNDLYYLSEKGNYQQIGSTLDDAAGEAFDKVARMLDLGFPGGPAIEKYVLSNSFENIPDVSLPRAWGAKDGYTFSFSGLKSEVRRIVEKSELTEELTYAIAKEFQESVTEVLSTKLLRAAREKGVRSILVSGGVAANARLREKILEEAGKYGFDESHIFFPETKLYCTDNAAMIGAAAYHVPKDTWLQDKEIFSLQPGREYVL